eukprot:7206080-Karenia_brevis.AAC.1
MACTSIVPVHVHHPLSQPRINGVAQDRHAFANRLADLRPGQRVESVGAVKRHHRTRRVLVR